MRIREKLRHAFWLTVASVMAACAAQPPPEIGQAFNAIVTNGGFETGTPGLVPPAPWALTTNINPGITVQSPQTKAGLNLAAGGSPRTTTLAAASMPGTADPDLGAAASLRLCRYGNQCARINFHSSSTYGFGQNVNTLSQAWTIAASDVDPTDGKIHIRFVFAPVLQNPAHPANQQPYYFIQISKTNAPTSVLYSDFNTSGLAGIPWKSINTGTANEIDYLDWTLVDVSPDAAALKIGDTVLLEAIAAGCQPNGHFGELYLDGIGATIPGINVVGTGPAQANAGTNITYTLTYRNGSAVGETGVVLTFTIPPNTTYQAFTAPAGMTCTTPMIGATGVVTCTLAGTLNAGASGAVNITVNINGGAPSPVVAANYNIKSTQEPQPLNGTKILTTVGCAKDADCQGGNWCNISLKQCLPKIANGVTMPTDAGHLAPAPILNGLCNAAAATLVCQSGVCDSDNKCGYVNNSGSCTIANQTVVCRSGVCDPDLKCGYANGDGPCTAANAGTVCRSLVCDPDLKCGYANGDGPCTAATAGTVCRSQVCDPDLKCGYSNAVGPCTAASAATVCRSKVCDPDLKCGFANGDGPCTAATQTTVCRSGVCDPDLKCGYANGDGPCTVATQTTICRSLVCDPNDLKCGYAVGDGPCSALNAGTVCRSLTCSVALTCTPAAGCNVDGDCAGGNWCNITTHMCSPKLANGAAIPTDAPHMNPTLNGTCTAAAALLVCQSGVCDTKDNKCGYTNGIGPCTAANAGTICRSGVCDPDLKCGYANGDGPCTAANGGTICRSGVCDPDLKCGLTNNVGPCTAATATTICRSGVCDPDLKCGFANGAGPCTAANQAIICRSAICDLADSKCGFANGDGPCTTATAGTICRSGVCDPDLNCGYANGDGPCTKVNGGLVCRSMSCSVDGNCQPAGGCNRDADCAAGSWCEESTHTCKPQLANGAAMPADQGHQETTLDATCLAPAAVLVCQAGVCDTGDNACGYANGSGPCNLNNASQVCRSAICDTDGLCGYATGDGPCSAMNAGTVCRSGACSMMGVCLPPGACLLDAPCQAKGQWCNETTSECTPKLPNGAPLPTDPAHQETTLNGTCTQDSGVLVCQSGVCDPKDNTCGLALGSGPCTAETGASICRTGYCDPGTSMCAENPLGGGFRFAGGGFCSFGTANSANGESLLALLAMTALLLVRRSRRSSMAA
ncbi:MAG TPA: hypothetical protein PK472_00320 [Pseudomonadota bacterium]|nr:hypothetical protein [Pseudomonadota bacterium]HNN53360.1 hypothetical protein [Pseudomonadota bacterium]